MNVQNNTVDNKPKVDEKALKEMMEKAKAVQKKAETFSKKFVTKFKEDLLGVSILPPEKKGQKEIKLFVLINDASVEMKDKGVFLKKKQEECKKICEGQDFISDVYLYSEVKQAMYDDNKDITNKVTKSTPVYQKNNVMNAFVLPEVHKEMVLEKFERYVVSYVGVGSILRGDGNAKSDIDVFMIIDDTDVKQMSRMELQDKIRNIVYSMSMQAQEMTGIKIPLHIQTYLLTDFWDMLKECSSPVIYTFLRDGMPFFDRGIYRPWRLLLEMGRIKPSREAVAKHTDAGDMFYERAKKKLLSVVVEDLYYSVLNPAQSLLMLKGIAPPTHKESAQLFREIIVKQEKLTSKKYADILEEFVVLFKKWEYNEVTEMSGVESEKYMKKADDFRKTVFPIIDKLNYQVYKTKLQQKKISKKDSSKRTKTSSAKKAVKKNKSSGKTGTKPSKSKKK